MADVQILYDTESAREVLRMDGVFFERQYWQVKHEIKWGNISQ